MRYLFGVGAQRTCTIAQTVCDALSDGGSSVGRRHASTDKYGGNAATVEKLAPSRSDRNIAYLTTSTRTYEKTNKISRRASGEDF